jgi:hypothetical protein
MWVPDVAARGAGAVVRSIARRIMILILGRSCRLKRIIMMLAAAAPSPASSRRSIVGADVAGTA